VFARKIDAERYLTSVEHSKMTGGYIDPAAGRVTVAEWAERWMASRVHLKPKTIASYESLLRSRVLPRWGDVPVAQVTNAAVVGWVAEMRAGGLSAQRTRHAYHVLKALLDAAVADNRLARNPIAGVKLPRLPRGQQRYLTHEQLAALADAAGDYRSLVLVLGYCGLRWGEAAGLRVGRVDPLRGRLIVAETVVEVHGRAIFETPKTHQARTVPVPRFLRGDLSRQLAGKGPDEFVFTSPRGGMLRVGNFRRGCFDAAATSVGLEGLTPHELRHTAASLAIRAGATVKAVQGMLGHASAAMTLDRYGHLFDDELDAVAERLDTAAGVSGVCPPAEVVEPPTGTANP
jgi:integrase